MRQSSSADRTATKNTATNCTADATTSIPAALQNINDNLSQSRILFANADSDLNTIWSSLSSEKKKELLPSQRQRIKTIDAMCGKVSMQGNDSEVKKMIDCQTQMTSSRVDLLKN